MIRSFIPSMAFLGATFCAMGASYVFFAMIGEVNRHRPGNNQIRNFIVLPDTYLAVWREYRQTYPKGKLAAGLITLLSAFIGLIVFAFLSSAGVPVAK